MERWPWNLSSASQNWRMVITLVAFNWFCHFPALRSGAYWPPPPTPLPGTMLCATKWKGRDLNVEDPQLIRSCLKRWSSPEQLRFHWSQSEVPVTGVAVLAGAGAGA
jgi:hypothetical protein